MQSTSVLGLLALLAVGANAIDYGGPYFIISDNGGPIVKQRLDPIISPGKTPSNHVHNIFGANTFKANWDYDSAQKSSCNNMGPKADHSNYWYPALYYTDGSQYTWVPGNLEIYYHFDPIDGKARTMFPHAFKMVAGDAMLRHDSGAAYTEAIKWYCHGPEIIKIGSFPETFTGCPKYPWFSGEIWFPFCWDGINEFDPKQPYLHVTYGDTTDPPSPTSPMGSPQGGKCPPSHSTPLPQLFMEFHHDISQFKVEGAKNFVLAQGDPTGSGMHADFVNGWEDGPKSLRQAIALKPGSTTETNCNVGESGRSLTECFDLVDDATQKGCKVTPTTDEKVDGPFGALPGCNPIQPSGVADATVQTSCPGYAPGTVSGNPGNSSSNPSPISSGASGPVYTAVSSAASMPSMPSMPAGNNAGFNGRPSNTNTAVVGGPSSAASAAGPGSTYQPNPISVKDSKGGSDTWHFQGCFTDLTASDGTRTGTRSLGTRGSGETATECANHCFSNGFNIAGAEKWSPDAGNQCFCGNSLVSSKKVTDSDCHADCKGEICGAANRLSVFAKSGTTLGMRKRSSHKKRHVRHLESNLAFE